MQRGRAIKMLIAKSPWIPNLPTGKQLLFLTLPDREVFYGGQVGGGKSDALLMGALMFADVPGYNAIIFRRTYPELSQADGLIHRSKQWLAPTPAQWNEGQMRWTFPSGATLRFAHMQREDDKFNYQGGQYQFIGFDELTGFTETQYTYLLSRLRKLRSSPVPLRVRSASNPGNIGHDWVYERFVIGPHPFVSATLDDNPYLSTEEYKAALAELDDITRAQLLEGKWVTATGEKPFRREFWRNKNRFSEEESVRIRNRCLGRWITCDSAQLDDEEAAYTVFLVAELDVDYVMKIKEVWRGRPEFNDLPTEVVSFAYKHNRDGKLKGFIVEHASSGIQLLQVLKHTAPEWLKPILHGAKPLGKEPGWAQAGVWCKRGLVHLPEPGPHVPWLMDLEEELYRIPNARFKDQADALAMAVNRLKHFLSQRWLAVGHSEEQNTMSILSR